MGTRVLSKRWTNAGLLLMNLLFGRLSRFLRTYLVAIFLTKEDAGLGFLAMALGAGALAFFETGTRQIIITAKESDDGLLATGFWIEFAKGALLALVLFACGLAAGDHGTVFGGTRELLFLSALIPLSI
ncbi:MAG: oligosaccharide flippase family protein, partial [Myxococcales bacterium]|nr:oligosaccharide flippase family protein [Myxococcales bacterium]